MIFAVGEVGALACLEVQPVLAAARGCVIEHLLYADIEGCVRGIVARQALKPNACGAGCLGLDFSLHIDVREHAVRQQFFQLERAQDVEKLIFDGADGQRRAGHRIAAQHDIADGIGKAIEDLPQDIVDIIRR